MGERQCEPGCDRNYRDGREDGGKVGREEKENVCRREERRGCHQGVTSVRKGA